MKIGSIAIALIAEYGDCWPGAISLSGSSCRTAQPRGRQPALDDGNVADVADAPASRRGAREQRHEQTRLRRRAVSRCSVMLRASRCNQSAARVGRRQRSKSSGGSSRLTTRNDSRGKSKKNPGMRRARRRPRAGASTRSSSGCDRRHLQHRVPAAVGAQHASTTASPRRGVAERRVVRRTRARNLPRGRRHRSQQLGRRDLHRRRRPTDRCRRRSRAARAPADTSGSGPPTADPAKLHLRQTDRLRQAAERERQHVARSRARVPASPPRRLSAS